MRAFLILLMLGSGGAGFAGGGQINGNILDLPSCTGWKIRCFGTEPFWALTFGPNMTAEWTEPSNVNTPATMSFTTGVASGTPLSSPFTTSTGIVGTVTHEPAQNCNDGASDFTYSLRVNFTALPQQTQGGTDLNGILTNNLGQQNLCCRILPN